MFIDEATITVEAGDGGNGCYSYHRTKSDPRGKADGGSGGRGGHVYVEGSEHLHTLQDVSYRRLYRARRGTHGKGGNKTGKSGEDVVIPVPLGTLVHDFETNIIVCDCVENGRRVRVARGGRRGRGNVDMVNRDNRRPDMAEPGAPGEKRKLRLVLKVLADVGLVGRPNAGKSTFLSRISRARPAIADYPFTTKHPHLGIANRPDTHDSFVVADMPGLVENSHEGKGLGIRFLKHIERTRVLAVMVEAISTDPVAEAETLLRELGHYSPGLLDKPRCFVLTKADLVPPDLEAPGRDWFLMSSVTGQGVGQVLDQFGLLLRKEQHTEPDWSSRNVNRVGVPQSS